MRHVIPDPASTAHSQVARQPPSRFRKFMVLGSTLFALAGSPSDAIAGGAGAAAAAGGAASAARQVMDKDEARPTPGYKDEGSNTMLITYGAMILVLGAALAYTLKHIKKTAKIRKTEVEMDDEERDDVDHIL